MGKAIIPMTIETASLMTKGCQGSLQFLVTLVPRHVIYGTGDMTEIEFLLEYRLEGIMGGDNIPRRSAELIKFVKGE